MLLLKLLLTVLTSYLLVKLVIKFSHKLNLYDVPNSRSHHCNITPSGAGIGFISAFFISILFFEFQLLTEYWCIFSAIIIVFVMGIYDDRHEVSAKLKFIAIFFAVFILWTQNISINTLGIWYGYELTLSPWIALIFSMFALAGFTNALNLIDGIDGLSSSISIVILFAFLLIGIEYNNHLMLILSSFTIAVTIGFLFLNWNPAKIFMGDSGSLSLGFIISVLAVLSLEYIHPIVILYLAAIPVLDTLVVMTRRIRRGESPFQADKTHIHHILVNFFNMNVKKTVFFLTILQIIFTSTGYVLIEFINDNPDSMVAFFVMLIFALTIILFYMIFTGMDRRQKILDENTTLLN